MNKKNILKTCLPLTLALAFSQSAFASGPIAQCGTDQPLVWGSGGANIPFNPDQGNLGPVDNAEAVAAVAEAFDVWGAVSTSTATYSNGGLLPVDVDITNFNPFLNPTAPDGLSAIVFDDTGEIFDLLFGAGSGILGFAGPEWINNGTCEILEGVSFLNGPSFTDPVAALDVMVHEFGHYSGLGHTVVNGQMFIGAGDTSGPSPEDAFGFPDPNDETIATMYPFYFGPAVGTRTLHLDDAAGLSALYPDPSFEATTASISGTVFLSNGTTPITGVNVIARNESDPFKDASSAISGDVNLDGSYIIEGLTPGASYRVYIDEILAGGFSTTLDASFPNNEEYYSGASESNNVTSPDPVTDFVLVTPGETGVDIIANSSAPGEPLPLGDDASIELTMPFEYQICGQSFNSVFVNSNGNLTFGAGDTDFSESAAELLSGPPRIAAVWDDLNPAAGGFITFQQSRRSFEVIYNEVPEFGSTATNTFSIKFLRNNPGFNVFYGDVAAVDGIAGASCGSLITSGFETAVDLSELQANGRIPMNKSPAVFETFTAANPADLANTVLMFDTKVPYNDNWSESNDTFETATPIELPFSSADVKLFTAITTPGDVDFYTFDTTGALFLDIEIVSGGVLDTVIGLFDSAGNLITADDDGGNGLLSKIALGDLPADTYTLLVLTFDETAPGGRYVMEISESNAVALDLGDDASQEVELGFRFPFNGESYDSVFVNSNGNVTFGSGNTDFSESVAELLDGSPRIAPLWDDLSPNQGGAVSVDFSTADTAVVVFDSVPRFLAGDSNNFTITLRADGSYTVDYGNIDATGGLVGSTEGNGAADPGESDLSGATLSASGTSYENFSDADNDLSNTSLDFTL